MITGSMLMLIILSVGCSALAQIALRHGMSQGPVQLVLAAGDVKQILLAVVVTPGVLGGLALYGLSAMMWLFVLARLDVSIAYPFVALGFLVTMALGCTLLGEAFSLRKLAGTLVVMLGVWLVAAAR